MSQGVQNFLGIIFQESKDFQEGKVEVGVGVGSVKVFFGHHHPSVFFNLGEVTA